MIEQYLFVVYNKNGLFFLSLLISVLVRIARAINSFNEMKWLVTQFLNHISCKILCMTFQTSKRCYLFFFYSFTLPIDQYHKNQTHLLIFKIVHFLIFKSRRFRKHPSWNVWCYCCEIASGIVFYLTMII